MLIDSLLNKITEWAYDRYIIQDSTPKDQFIKAVAEMGELADAINKNNNVGIKDGIGDVIVCLNNIAVMCNTDIEDCREWWLDNPPTTTPDWNIPGAEYSFTEFKE